MDKLFIDMKDMIEITGYSRTTILNLIKEGLPYLQLRKGSSLKFRLNDVEAWILERTDYKGECQ